MKESLDVSGLPRSLGTHRPGPIAERDAVLVQRIRNAGGRLLGKTLMTELGVDGLGVHLVHGTPHNPHARGCFPGGSSTGTAVAVASGLARFGVGGDGLGSIRVPSSFCGLFGLKPTHGRLPTGGMQRDAPTLAVPGPMTRTARDCALLWHVLDGHEPRALTPLRPARVGLLATSPAAPAGGKRFSGPWPCWVATGCRSTFQAPGRARREPSSRVPTRAPAPPGRLTSASRLRAW